MDESRTTAKTLRRSKRERMVAGVAGGLAQHFNVDPVLARLAFVILTFWSGIGLLLYIVLAIVMPERPPEEPEPVITGTSISLGNNRGREIIAYTLVGLGAVVLAGNLGLFHILDWRYIWPLMLIAIGAWLLAQRNRD
jgi:phage shock protein C